MTAHRRIRKTKSKRSTTDVDPYTERYRKASDAAKAARAATRGGAGEGGGKPGEAASRGLALETRAHEVGKPSEGIQGIQLDGARIVGISLVKPEDSIFGYTIEVGGESHFTPAEGEVAKGLEPDAEYLVTLPDGRQETLRTEGAPDAEAVVERGSSEPPRHTLEVGGPYQQVHKVFFEQEVNLVPTHVGTEVCACDIQADHWVELGEN